MLALYVYYLLDERIRFCVNLQENLKKNDNVYARMQLHVHADP